jgi:hypothetical protein
LVNDQTEERLKRLRRLGVKNIEFVDGLNMVRVEFFPSSDEIKERPKAEVEADEKVSEATGLTRRQSRDLLGVDE